MVVSGQSVSGHVEMACQVTTSIWARLARTHELTEASAVRDG